MTKASFFCISFRIVVVKMARLFFKSKTMSTELFQFWFLKQQQCQPKKYHATVQLTYFYQNVFCGILIRSRNESFFQCLLEFVFLQMIFKIKISQVYYPLIMHIIKMVLKGLILLPLKIRGQFSGPHRSP